MTIEDSVSRQQRQRAALFAAHQRTIDTWWDDDGSFTYKSPDGAGGYRRVLWHCLAYLAGDAHCVAKANRIIITHFHERPDHFLPGAAIEILWHHKARLTDEAREKLERLVRLNLQYMSTPDLQFWGYNDNHPCKAFYTLIVGGEMFNEPVYVELGIRRLHEALALVRRNGFPSEYNSPTYTTISLQPLACIVEQATSAEARQLALELEHHFWHDVALHFDPRAGLPAGPHSRAYARDCMGLLSNLTGLLVYLFPERFDLDLLTEVYERGENSAYIEDAMRAIYPAWVAPRSWLASATYHLPEGLEQTLFAKPAGTQARGMIESGSWTIDWKDEERPLGAPSTLHLGPRRSLCTTYFGKQYSLGTTQFSWLNNAQANGFYTTIARGDGRSLREASVYYSRMFFDERSPYGEIPEVKKCFHEEGDIRTLQHCGTAMVLYNPHPLVGTFKRLLLGLFRPLRFSRPEELWVGDVPVPSLNYLSQKMAPIAIRDGAVYMGIIPLRLTDCGQARDAHLHIHTYSDHLAILMSSYEDWKPRAFTFEEIVSINAGFICELRDADEFASFADFRDWLAAGVVEDEYDLSHRRTVSYRQGELTLSARYSPYQTGFQHATVNGRHVETPQLAVDGIAAPVQSMWTS